MSYIFKPFLRLTITLIALILLPIASHANDDALILTHKNAADMHMECMRMASHKKINTPEVHHCRRTCDDFRKSHVLSNDFDARAQKSKACRSAYQNATGKDVVPTLPKDYVAPKQSPRG